MKRIFLFTLTLIAMTLTVSAQKIFMTGDSHVSIKIYPIRVGELLAEHVPEAQSFPVVPE